MSFFNRLMYTEELNQRVRPQPQKVPATAPIVSEADDLTASDRELAQALPPENTWVHANGEMVSHRKSIVSVNGRDLDHESAA